jgi:hypothetical protein
MFAVLKNRIWKALLLWLVLAPLRVALAADAPLHKALALPSQQTQVIPRRAPRPISRGEIYQAIQDDLARAGISRREELRLGDLIIQSSVPVLQVDMGLKVKRIGFDPLRRVVVFELWASHEPQYLPFEVTTRRDPESFGLSSEMAGGLVEAAGGGVRTENSAKSQGASPARSKLPILAKPGTPATLIMLGQNMRITTTVVPLQPGSKGQRILVREVTTARVMTAEVVDEGLLQTSF